MDWDAIIGNRTAALVRLVAVVFAVAGLVLGGPVVASLSGDARRRILRVLRPAESALRRLIFVAARELVVAVSAKRAGSSGPYPKGCGSPDRVPPFALFDPRKWFWELSNGRRFVRGAGPRISSFDDERPAFDAPASPSADAKINPVGLCRRLQALHKALEHIPAQALRLARMQSRRRAAGEPFKRTEPLRGGTPPGHRKNPTHEVDEILADCHFLAMTDRPHNPP